jgi:hypothetical protein
MQIRDEAEIHAKQAFTQDLTKLCIEASFGCKIASTWTAPFWRFFAIKLLKEAVSHMIKICRSWTAGPQDPATDTAKTAQT